MAATDKAEGCAAGGDAQGNSRSFGMDAGVDNQALSTSTEDNLLLKGGSGLEDGLSDFGDKLEKLIELSETKKVQISSRLKNGDVEPEPHFLVLEQKVAVSDYIRNLTDLQQDMKKLQELARREKMANEDEFKSRTAVFKEELYKEVMTLMETELGCVVCNEVFIQPCVIDCGHSFCSYCIKEWSRQKQECPICRKGITAVKKHVEMENFVSKLHSMLSAEIKTKRQELITERENTERERSEQIRTASSRTGLPPPLGWNSRYVDAGGFLANVIFDDLDYVRLSLLDGERRVAVRSNPSASLSNFLDGHQPRSPQPDPSDVNFIFDEVFPHFRREQAPGRETPHPDANGNEEIDDDDGELDGYDEDDAEVDEGSSEEASETVMQTQPQRHIPNPPQLARGHYGTPRTYVYAPVAPVTAVAAVPVPLAHSRNIQPYHVVRSSVLPHHQSSAAPRCPFSRYYGNSAVSSTVSAAGQPSLNVIAQAQAHVMQAYGMTSTNSIYSTPSVPVLNSTSQYQPQYSHGHPGQVFQGPPPTSFRTGQTACGSAYSQPPPAHQNNHSSQAPSSLQYHSHCFPMGPSTPYWNHRGEQYFYVPPHYSYPSSSTGSSSHSSGTNDYNSNHLYHCSAQAQGNANFSSVTQSSQRRRRPNAEQSGAAVTAPEIIDLVGNGQSPSPPQPQSQNSTNGYRGPWTHYDLDDYSHNQPYVIPPPRQRRRMTRDAGDQSARQEHSIPSRTNTGQQGSRNSVRFPNENDHPDQNV